MAKRYAPWLLLVTLLAACGDGLEPVGGYGGIYELRRANNRPVPTAADTVNGVERRYVSGELRLSADNVYNLTIQLQQRTIAGGAAAAPVTYTDRGGYSVFGTNLNFQSAVRDEPGVVPTIPRLMRGTQADTLFVLNLPKDGAPRGDTVALSWRRTN